MQALALLLAVVVTSSESSGGVVAPAGGLRGRPDIALPMRADRNSCPTRENQSPLSSAVIPTRTPRNSENAIQQVDFESEGLASDPAAPPRCDRLSVTDSRHDNLFRGTDSLFRGAEDTGDDRPVAGELQPVPGSEPSARDPYAVPDLGNPDHSEGERKLDRGGLDRVVLEHEPAATRVPAAQHSPSDPFSIPSVHDPDTAHRDDALVPRDLAASPAGPPPTGPRGTKQTLTAMPEFPTDTIQPRAPAHHPTEIASTTDAAQGPLTARTAAVSPVVASPPPANHPLEVARNARAQYEARPWAPLFATLLALFASGGLNIYLIWITWDTHQRYQELATDIRHEASRDKRR